MRQDIPFSEEFIKQICATYSMHEPLIDIAFKDHRELKMFVGMLRTAIEMSDDPNQETIAVFNRLLAHMDSTIAMLKRLHEIAKQSNTVIREYSV